MSAVRQVGIKMVVDAQSVTTELPRAAREFENLGNRASEGAARATRSLAQVSMSVRDIVQGAAGLHLVGNGIEAISNAITSLPRQAFDFSKNLEVSQVGMAGILGSMTAINGQQLDYNRALQISREYIGKLNDDALRTAATSQELVQVFQALLAPGLGAKMTLEEIRQLTVVGTNAVKSMGLDASQVVQELRDLVAGGITPASSTLATALGLKDSDIAKAKASSEGLFKFLMDRLQGFEASSEAFSDTFKGRLDQIREGATRVAAEGMEPLITASKAALGEISNLFVTIDENKNVTLNQGLVDGIKELSTMAVSGVGALRDFSVGVYEHRDAIGALVAVYASMKLGSFVADMAAATAANVEAAQASRLAAAQAAAESAGNVEVAATSRQKVAAYLAELSANAASAQAEVVTQAAQLATLNTTREAIVVARAEVVAKMDAVRATMAQAEAQIAAARAAGAQSIALALVREGTQALTAAQARHAVLMTELATLGKQQAGVQAAIAAATTAQTVATNAAAASAAQLAAAQGAASVAGRALGGISGFLGGPIGIITTLVTLGATAWTLWGDAGSDAERKLQGSVARSTPEIIADLDKQIATLQARNALAASGQADLAKRGGADVDRLAALKQQIDQVTANSAGQLSPSYRDEKLRALNGEFDALALRIRAADEQQKKLNESTAALSGTLALTATGAEQAWRKSIDGVKTAISIQEEYDSKLRASRTNFSSFEAAKPDPEKLRRAQEEQQQYEKGLAQERDKQIKELGASAATARTHAIDAEIAATKHGYKLLAAQAADSLAEVEAQRKQGQLSDSDALERRTFLQLADIDAQRMALQSELALLQGRKDSAKEQANIQGELAELVQKRANIEAQAAREQRELDAQAAEALQKRIEGYEQAARQAQESLRVAQLDALEIGKTGEALGALRQARVEATAKAFEDKAVTEAGIDLSGDAAKALRAQAQAVRDLAKVQGYNEAARMVHDYAKVIDEANAATQFELSLSTMSQREREIALEQYSIAIDLKKRLKEIDASNPADAEAAAKLKTDAQAAATRAQAGAQQRVLAREWQRTVDQIDDVFRTGFADMLNRGEEGWSAFTKSLSTTFKTTVANELYKAFAQPFVVNIVGNLLGLSGLSGIAQTVTGSGGNLLGLASNASSLYSLGSKAMGWLGLGSSATSIYSLGAGASGLGLTAGGGGLGLTAGGGGLGLTAGAGAGASASASAGAGASGLAAIPGWGWALAGLAGIAALAGKFDKSGTPHWGAAAEYDGTTLIGGDTVFRRSGTSGRYTAGAQAGVDAVARAVGDTLGGVAKAFGKPGGYAVMTGYSDDSSDDPGFGAFRVTQDGKKVMDWEDSRTSKWAPKIFADGEEGWKMYLSAITKDTKQALLNMDLPSWADTLLAAIGDAADMDALSAAVAQIGQIQTAFVQLGRTIDGFAGMGDKAFEALMNASGGIDALSANASSYYENFYSEEERRSISKRQLGAQLSGLGLEGFDFDAADARAKYRSAVEAALAQADAATGEAKAKAAETAAALLGLSAAVAQVTGAMAQATASASASTAQMQREQQERSTLEKMLGEQHVLWADLAQAQGDSATAAQRRYWIETAGMTAAEQAAYDFNAALRAQVSAAQRASSVLADLGSARFDLENQLLGLQGQGDEVARRTRERDLAQMTEGLADAERDRIIAAYDANVALRQQIAAQEAANAAAQQAVQAAQDAARAAEQLTAAWQSATDAIYGEVARIRGLTAGNTASSLAAARADFTIATAQARAGDQDAAKALPELSRALLAIAQSTATSAIELRRIQGQTAANLAETGGTLVGKYGLKVPAYDVGTNYITHDQLALVHEGEAIVPRAFNPAAFGAMLGDPQALRLLGQIYEVLLDIQAETRATAVSGTAVAKAITRVMNPARDALRTQEKVVTA